MPKFDDINVGDALPEREFRIDTRQLFLYNAAIWNAHRIHFDHPYATGVEGYPGLVNAGPLMGDWLSQCVLEWLGEDGELVSFEYSNRKASYVGDLLKSGGRVTRIDEEARSIELELFLVDEAGDNVTPGAATVRFPVN